MVREITPDARQSVLNLWMTMLTYREISERLGISEGAISGIITDARDAAPDLESLRKLSLVLEKRGKSPEDALRGATFLDRLDQLKIGTDTLDTAVSFYSRYGEEAPKILARAASLHLLQLYDEIEKSLVNNKTEVDSSRRTNFLRC